MADERLNDLGYRLERATRRSSFAKYLRENFEAFQATLKASGTRWETIARWAVESDLTGGKSLTPTAAKKSYERISAERRRNASAARAGDAVRSGIVQLGPAPTAKPSEGDPLELARAKLLATDNWQS